jgi:hypothetical protein
MNINMRTFALRLFNLVDLPDSELFGVQADGPGN